MKIVMYSVSRNNNDKEVGRVGRVRVCCACRVCLFFAVVKILTIVFLPNSFSSHQNLKGDAFFISKYVCKLCNHFFFKYMDGTQVKE